MAPREIGGLACHVVDDLPARAQPTVAVILCHGYGAPADDLVPIGAELLRTSSSIREGVRFYFPAALLDLEPAGLPGGRAWWPIDMNRLVVAAQTGRWDELRTGVPAGIEPAREGLLALIRGVQEETGLPLSRQVLGGFSQGAMLAMDISLRLPEPPGEICLASGCLVCEPEWSALATGRKPLRVLMSHGRQDPILPFFGAEALRDLLQASGHDVEFIEFDGGHTIPWQVLRDFSKRLVELSERAVDD